MDGTLVDSSAYHWQAWRRALAEVAGYQLTRRDFERTFGLRNDAILRLLLGEVAPDVAARIDTLKEEDYRRRVREGGLELLPGVAWWLERLRAGGWRQAVASSAPRANLELVLDVTGTARYFEAVLAADDASRGKPDPEVYFAAAARLGVPVERCVVIEDAPAAIRGAVAAGLKTVGVLRGATGQGAHLEVDRLDELPPDAFDRLAGSPGRRARR